MPASRAPYARPPWAVACWADDRAVYIELPMAEGGTPYVQAFPLTEGGLSKALWLMRSTYAAIKARCATPINYTKHPAVRRVRSFKPSEVTEDQRSDALAAIRKVGILR